MLEIIKLIIGCSFLLGFSLIVLMGLWEMISCLFDSGTDLKTKILSFATFLVVISLIGLFIIVAFNL